MKRGDRVETPDGAGTIVSEWRSFEWRNGVRTVRVDFIVSLDRTNGMWRKVYPPRELQAAR